MPRPIKFHPRRITCGGDKVRPIQKFERFFPFPFWPRRVSQRSNDVRHLKSRPIHESCQWRDHELKPPNLSTYGRTRRKKFRDGRGRERDAGLVAAVVGIAGLPGHEAVVVGIPYPVGHWRNLGLLGAASAGHSSIVTGIGPSATLDTAVELEAAEGSPRP